MYLEGILPSLEVNNVGTQRDDGYTVWNLQEMNYNDFPDIVGYMKDEKQGNRNLYIKDSIGMKNMIVSTLLFIPFIIRSPFISSIS